MRLLLESCINITAGLFGADTLHIPPQVTKQDMPHVVFERRTWAGDILKSALWHALDAYLALSQSPNKHRLTARTVGVAAGSSTCNVKLRYDVLTERQRCRNKSSFYYQKHPYSSLSQMGWKPFPCRAFMQSLKLLLFVGRSVVCRSWGSVSCSPDNCALQDARTSQNLSVWKTQSFPCWWIRLLRHLFWWTAWTVINVFVPFMWWQLWLFVLWWPGGKKGFEPRTAFSPRDTPAWPGFQEEINTFAGCYKNGLWGGGGGWVGVFMLISLRLNIIDLAGVQIRGSCNQDLSGRLHLH